MIGERPLYGRVWARECLPIRKRIMPDTKGATVPYLNFEGGRHIAWIDMVS